MALRERSSRSIWLALPFVAISSGMSFAKTDSVATRLVPTESTAAPRSQLSSPCSDCHEEQVVTVAHGPHSVLDSSRWQKSDEAQSSCTSCHGDIAVHLEDGGGDENIFGFSTSEPQQKKTASCQTCHADSHPQFARSSHSRSGLSCSDCHSVHSAAAGSGPLLKTETAVETLLDIDSVSASCYTCHPGPFAEFEFNERHRLREGVMSCTSCHDVHAQQNRRILGSFKQEQCTSCHAQVGGPFVFEHGASRVEGCSACHQAHGSPNRRLLRFQNVAESCYSCHGAVPQFHFGFNPTAPPRFDLTTQCTNCHSAIHGSNFDPFFLK